MMFRLLSVPQWEERGKTLSHDDAGTATTVRWRRDVINEE